MLKFKAEQFKIIKLIIILIFITLIIIDFDRFMHILYFKNDIRKIKVIDLFNKDMCDRIIKEGEEYASINGWTTRRHDNYPTTDNLITHKWKIRDEIDSIIKPKIRKELSEMYNIDGDSINLKEMFLVKYDINGQKDLEYHTDGSNFSFVISLNEDYTGGGTNFKYNNKTIKLKTGECLLFNGFNEHSGIKIESGTRYILTGFLSYNKYTYYDNYARRILSSNYLNIIILILLTGIVIYI